jgi:hypothetical protein
MHRPLFFYLSIYEAYSLKISFSKRIFWGMYKYMSRAPERRRIVCFFNWYSRGVESNRVHSALRPLLGLLCQAQVIMMMEKLVKWLAGETEVLGENLPQCRFVNHKSHMRPAAVGSQRLTAWATARPRIDLILLRDDGSRANYRNCILFYLHMRRWNVSKLCQFRNSFVATINFSSLFIIGGLNNRPIGLPSAHFCLLVAFRILRNDFSPWLSLIRVFRWSYAYILWSVTFPFIQCSANWSSYIFKRYAHIHILIVAENLET